MTVPTIRIFISSPGDVAEERDKARRVVADLQRQFGSRVQLETVLWEDLALPATASFQETIDLILHQRPIDIAVFILWSRLGSQLGSKLTRPDGTPYRSGTEREFDLMLAAFEQSGQTRPTILAYTRLDDETWRQKLSQSPGDRLEEMLSQRKLAEAFIREQFTDSDGRNLRAFHSYQTPATFAHRLKTHLRQHLAELLEGDSAAAQWDGCPYRSLEVFDIEHSPIFLGRDNETIDIIERLADQRRAGCPFVVILGSSGSGKSSLARAGVAATLLNDPQDEQIQAWRVAVFLPSVHSGTRHDDPPTNISAAANANPNGNDTSTAYELLLGLLRVLAPALPTLRTVSLEAIANGLVRDPSLTVELSLRPAFDAAAKEAGGVIKILLVLDQMEELWTDHRITPESREQFLVAVEALARSQLVSVVATLRSDFYAQAQQSPTFVRLKRDRGQIDLVAPDLASL